VTSLDEAGIRRLASERWFGGKGRPIVSASQIDRLDVEGGGLAILEIVYEEGPPELYTLLDPDGGGYWAALLRSLAGGEPGGSFRLEALPALGDLDGLPDRPLGADQSNTSFVVGGRLVVKCYRRVWHGPHPEVELVVRLGADGRLPFVPRAAGAIHWGDPPCALALLQAYVPGARDGWDWAGEELFGFLEGADAAETTDWSEALGGLVAELHGALAERLGTRPAEAADLEAWAERAASLVERVERLPDGLDGLAGPVKDELAALSAPRPAISLTRIHGDLHVGQILRSDAGYHVIDFEGEPTRPPEERRALDSPLRDVASMIRSFDNLARWRVRERGGNAGAAERPWLAAARQRFLEAYSRRHRLEHSLLRALEVEKAVYELAYATAYLPEWSEVARPALRDLLAETG
jgi:maltokinase